MSGYQAKLGEYLLGSKLGSGQFSKVRVGTKGTKLYAVKYMRVVSESGIQKTCLDLLLNEAKVMSKLEHPHLVRLYDYGEKGILEKPDGKQLAVLYLVLELVTGGELFDYIAASGRFSEGLARYYYRQLIGSLEFMHAQGFAHRDIKAQNLLLDDACDLKLADFGFAAPLAGRDGSGKLHTAKGTEGYTAPEIYAGKPYFGEKTDVFATGVVLYMMAAGCAPFSRTSSTDPLYRLFCLKNADFWSKAEKKGTFSAEFKAFLNSLLAFNPAIRPTLAELKRNPWFNGPVPTQAEVKAEIETRKKRVETRWKLRAAEEVAKREDKKSETGKKKATMGYGPAISGIATKSGVLAPDMNPADGPGAKKVPEYKPVVAEQTVMFSVKGPEELLEKAKEYCDSQKCDIEEPSGKYKIKARFGIYDDGLAISARVERVGENGIHCLRILREAGAKASFMEVFAEIKEYLLTDGTIFE